jgi:hypothetical protein
VGIATNFGNWIFTEYNKYDEMIKTRANPNPNPFTTSRNFEIMD